MNVKFAFSSFGVRLVVSVIDCFKIRSIQGLNWLKLMSVGGNASDLFCLGQESTTYVIIIYIYRCIYIVILLVNFTHNSRTQFRFVGTLNDGLNTLIWKNVICFKSQALHFFSIWIIISFCLAFSLTYTFLDRQL